MAQDQTAGNRTKLMGPSRRAKGMGTGVGPTPGSPSHIVLLLVIAELVALIIIRRSFSGAHGG